MADESKPGQTSEGLSRRFAARLRSLLQPIAVVWGRIWNSLVRAPWLCAYDTLAVVLIVFLFVFNDQGQDLLRISAEPDYWFWNLSFLVGTAALSLTLWYTARLLLGREFEGYPLDLSRTLWLKKWMPRLLGAAVPLSVAVGYAMIRSDDRQFVFWGLSGLYALLTLGLFWFFVARRTLFDIPRGSLIEDQAAELGRFNLLLMWGAGILSFLLLAAFLRWPVALPQLIGAPAIIVLGLAGIVLFGSMVLTYAFLSYGQPAGTALVLVLAVIFAFWNDNHEVRTLEDSGKAGAADAAQERPSPSRRYQDWRAVHAGFRPIDGREPLILVAASGGGIRAAYWTASTLATLDAVPGFSDNLFAISGVSGGSLGAATYVAIKRRQLETGEAEDPLRSVRTVLGRDFLSPVVAGLLFPDLAQRFLPVPIAEADRQRFLEMAWEDAFGPSPNSFSNAFMDLYGHDSGKRLPSLLLNATVVDSGRRAIVSNMNTDDFTDAVDLLADGFSTQAVRLSAAAGMSARFTFVSPPGSLWRPRSGEDGPDRVKLRVVDGGYFENSGAATVMDLLSELGEQHRNLFPILVLIRNDPQAPFVCHRSGAADPLLLDEGPEGPPSGDFLSEVAAPIRALLNARSARGRLAEVDAALAVEGRRPGQGSTDSDAVREVERLGGAVIEISLAAVAQAKLESAGRMSAEEEEEEKQALRRRLIEPPLGWSLSADAQEDMNQVLKNGRGGLRRELDTLSELLGGEVDPARHGCNPR